MSHTDKEGTGTVVLFFSGPHVTAFSYIEFFMVNYINSNKSKNERIRIS